MARQDIETWDGRMVGYIETEPNGDQTGFTWRGTIVGYYKKQYDHTEDFYGRVVSQGNSLSALVWQAFK